MRISLILPSMVRGLGCVRGRAMSNHVDKSSHNSRGKVINNREVGVLGKAHHLQRHTPPSPMITLIRTSLVTPYGNPPKNLGTSTLLHTNSEVGSRHGYGFIRSWCARIMLCTTVEVHIAIVGLKVMCVPIMKRLHDSDLPIQKLILQILRIFLFRL
ncbi:hypothetical protein F4820DRAFT_58661 [Hypoxylon rubiginosum]|uniref:Uncharacterized protein n=1 Tax=Hypoxylon rubiginosum TaxID=110542 RepID=A0ACB9YQ58_9PEZI|nr:hypothetical protein F4820DRAFT_58661 [Hypoxylon rubiginosum]